MEEFKKHIRQVTFSGVGLNISTALRFLSKLPYVEGFRLDGVEMAFDDYHPSEGIPLCDWLDDEGTSLDVPLLRRVAVSSCVVDMGALLVMLNCIGSLQELSIEDDVYQEDYGLLKAGLGGMSEEDLKKVPKALRDVKRLRLVNSITAAFNIKMTGWDVGRLTWMAVDGLQALTLSLAFKPTDILLAQMLSRHADTLEELTIYADGVSYWPVGI